MGASTVYHLASRGYKDVLLLERESFSVPAQPDVVPEEFVISSILKSTSGFPKKVFP